MIDRGCVLPDGHGHRRGPGGRRRSASSAPRAAWCWSRATCCACAYTAAAARPRPASMRVLQVCAEIYPLLKTGGLADVAGALPPALRRAAATCGCCCRASRRSDGRRRRRERRSPTCRAPLRREPARAAAAASLPDGAPVAYVIDAPRCTTAPGNPYADAAGQPTPTTTAASRCWAGSRRGWPKGSTPDWRPQVVHGHDWHAGLAPAYMRRFARQPGGALRRQRLHRAQPGLPGHVPGQRLRRAGPARASSSACTASSSTARCRS